jgi:hypothetical protein
MADVMLTQSLQPDGTREIRISLPDHIAEMATRQVLSCEVIPDTKVFAFYSHPTDNWDEEEDDESCVLLPMKDDAGIRQIVPGLIEFIRECDEDPA